MLTIDVASIPLEGLDVAEPLAPSEVHLEGEESFTLDPGGSLQCHLELVDGNTVHVRGHLRAQLGLECGRCLESFSFAVDQELDLFYLPHQAGETEEEDEVELTDRDMVVAYYESDRLDLGAMIREQFFLAIPMKRLCREDCRGRCRSCGVDWNASRCNCPEVSAEPDPRLAGLKKLFEKGSH